MFGKLFQDLSGDWSSGLLVKFLSFVSAVEYGILCLALRADLTATATAVGSLLGMVTAFQWMQSATKNGAPITLPADAHTPIGFMAGIDGRPDLARWVKLASFVAGVVILHIAAIWIRDQLMNATAVSGAFFLLCTSQEFGTKAFGV